MSTFDDRVPSTGQTLPDGPSVRTQIAWGGVGFLLGVIVWHFVGFWTFLSAIVFRGPEPVSGVSDLSTSSTAAAMPTVPAPNPRNRTASISAKRAETVFGTAPAQDAASQPSSHCTALALDRTAGTTTPTTCSIGDQPHRLVENSQRGDRAALSPARDTDWSVIVDAGTETADADVSGGKLDANLDPRLAARSVRLD